MEQSLQLVLIIVTLMVYKDWQTQLAIDLSHVGALEKGVSRRHLALDASVHPPLVTDLDSCNHSYINGEQLQPQRAYTLESGDELRLGYLTMRVYYK